MAEPEQEQQQQLLDWKEIPRFRIDLDLPPRERWKHIVPHFKPYLKVKKAACSKKFHFKTILIGTEEVFEWNVLLSMSHVFVSFLF